MGLNLELDRKLEVTWHSVILGILRECLQDLRMIFHKSTTLGGNSHSALHTVNVWFANWLLADVCSYHTGSTWCLLDLSPSMVIWMIAVSLGTEEWGLWALPTWNLTICSWYLGKNYGCDNNGDMIGPTLAFNVKKSFISYPRSASVSYLVPYPQKHLLEQIGNIRWKGKWYRSQTQVTSGLIRSSAA